MTNRLVEIDNSGGGDCGYYAIAIGLISIMQQELGKPIDQRPVFSKYLSYFQNHAEKAELIRCISEYNLAHPNLTFLTRMMIHLREILYKRYIEDIHQHFEKNDQTIMSDILGIFYYFYNNQSEDTPKSTYINDFYRDRQFRQKMYSFVNDVKRFEVGTSNRFTDPEIAELIRANFFCGNEENFFNENTSDVGRVLKLKRHPRLIWATHADLNELADTFNVQLKTTGLGAPTGRFERDGRPILRLHHPNAGHWTSMLNEVYIPDNRYKLKSKHHHSNELNNSDIIDVLDQYQLGNNKFLLFFRDRKHLSLANEIRQLCSHQQFTPELIVAEMIKTLPADINTSGHYFSAVKFLCQKTHQVAALEKKIEELSALPARLVNKR